MAITFDAVYSQGTADARSWNHTVGAGSNKILLVLCGMKNYDNIYTTVTFNSVSLTKLGEISGDSYRAQIWYLLDPPEGTHTVQLPTTGIAYDVSAGSVSFSGVDQSTPFRDHGGVTNLSYSDSVTVDSITTDVIVDILATAAWTSATPGASQTLHFFDTLGSLTAISASSRMDGADTSTTVSWSGSGGGGYHALYAASLKKALSMDMDGDGSLPVPTITAGCDGVVESLPLLSLVNCYVDVPHSDVDESLPIFTISATALQSTVIAGDCTLPIFTISSLAGYQTESDADVDFPLPTASASSLTGEIHEGDIDVPPLTISATLLAGGISQGVASLPIFTFVGKTINTGTVSESVPAFTISAYAHGPLLHTLDETLPLLQIVANLVQQSTAFRCYVLNTENSAITEYDNFPFNSFCTFKGKHLAAGSNGITLLEGNKDNSTDISAYLNVGNNDFDLPNIKKITDAYLSMKGDGSYYLTVASDDGTPHSYLLTATAGDRIRNLKTHVGKGKKGRFFELELSNIAGADFELYDMVLNVELLKRNI